MSVIESTHPSDTGNNPHFRLTGSKTTIRHRSHTTKNQRKLERLKQADAQLTQAEQCISSSKVGTLHAFSEHIRSWSSALCTLSTFYGQRKIVRMKWESHILQRQALSRSMDGWMDGLVIRNSETAHAAIVIAFGAAGFSSTSKHNSPTPQQEGSQHAIKAILCCSCGRVYDKPGLLCVHNGEQLEPMRRRKIVEQDSGQHCYEDSGQHCQTVCNWVPDNSRSRSQCRPKHHGRPPPRSQTFQETHSLGSQETTGAVLPLYFPLSPPILGPHLCMR